jgi:hypothetical protein
VAIQEALEADILVDLAADILAAMEQTLSVNFIKLFIESKSYPYRMTIFDII